MILNVAQSARCSEQTELASMILEDSGYIQMWQADKSPEAPGRLENLRELITGLSAFETLPEFLEHVSLVLETQDTQQTDLVTIMTLHGAKGLEFDAVFLPGWEEGLFPSQRTMDENGLKGLEEERRLAYVGITPRGNAHMCRLPLIAGCTANGLTPCRHALLMNCPKIISAQRRTPDYMDRDGHRTGIHRGLPLPPAHRSVAANAK